MENLSTRGVQENWLSLWGGEGQGISVFSYTLLLNTSTVWFLFFSMSLIHDTGGSYSQGWNENLVSLQITDILQMFNIYLVRVERN